MPYTTIGDVKIYWESHGKGKPLLIISGVSGGTWSYEESIAAWSRYSRVLVFDNMGAGLSSMPDRPYKIAEMADQAAAVLEAADEERAYVVGLSMGGNDCPRTGLAAPSTRLWFGAGMHPLRRQWADLACSGGAPAICR